jgi:hypothetical protein
MSQIEIDKGLAGYLEKDIEVVATSRRDWKLELEALCRLTDVFRRLTDLIIVKETNLNLPAQLLLVALNQLYGVASELLRRRTKDAQALTRRAIEAAGIAYRLWKHPELIQVFNEAYPHINDAEHPDQFTPSKKYRQEFKLELLFPGDSSALQTLKSLYELFSAGASHAGLGALTGHQWKDDTLSLSVRETDRVEIGRSWHAIINSYWEILRVFLAILRSAIPLGMAVMVEEDMKQWLADYIRTTKERVTWIPGLREPTL